MLDKDFYNLVQNGRMTTGNNWGTGVLLVHPATGKILLAERTDTHNWASPGGKVENGESPMTGCIRECLEESNVGINSMICYDSALHVADNGKNWVSFMFLSRDFDDSNIKNQESEMGEFGWYSVAEALDMNLFYATRKSIERAIELGVLSVDDDVDYLDDISDGNGDFPECCNCVQNFVPNPYYTDTEGSSYSYNPDVIDWL